MEDKFLTNIKYIVKCNKIIQKVYKTRIIEISIESDLINKDLFVGRDWISFNGSSDYLTTYEDTYGLKLLNTNFSFADYKYSFVLELQNGDEILLYTDCYESKELEVKNN